MTPPQGSPYPATYQAAPPLPAVVPLASVLAVIDTRLDFLRSCDGSYAYEQDVLELRRKIVEVAREWAR